MARYLQCLRSNKSESDACRALSKDYLECRMSKWVSLTLMFAELLTHAFSSGLMDRDNWENLGFGGVGSPEYTSSVTTSKTPPEGNQK